MEPGSTPRPLVQKKTWRDSLPIDMLLSAVSVLVVEQSSSEIPEGLMNNPVFHGCVTKTVGYGRSHKYTILTVHNTNNILQNTTIDHLFT